MIRVVLAEDHGLMRAGLAALLEASGEVAVVGSTAELLEVTDLARRTRAEVVILGATPHHHEAIATVRALTAELPDLAVVLLCDPHDPQRLRDALAAGARGCIAEDTPEDEVVQVLREARAGRRRLAPRLAARLMDAVAEASPGPDGVAAELLGLSRREREVVALVASGKTNAEVAIILGISHHTVGSHRRRIMSKLGLGNVVDVVKFAAQHGLLGGPTSGAP